MPIAFDSPLAMSVPVSKEMEDLQTVIHNDLRRKTELDKDAARLFARTFNLGVPRFDLPKTVVHTVHSFIRNDLQSWCNRSWQTASSQGMSMPRDDHLLDFYTIVSLGNGFDAAIATARVSQPYRQPRDGYYEIAQAAKENNLFAFQHSDWSWHYPGNTELFVYTKQISVSEQVADFNESMLRWLILNRQYLKQLFIPFSDRISDFDFDRISMCIDDIIDDPKYPHTNLSFSDLEKIGFFNFHSNETVETMKQLHYLFESESITRDEAKRSSERLLNSFFDNLS